MKFLDAWILGAALALTAVPGLADPRKLGTQWEGPDGNARITQLGLVIDGPQQPDATLYRRASFDWRRSNLQAGYYPKTSFGQRREGGVQLQVDIGAEGKPLACRVASSSGAADIDAHACPHVLAHTRFVPTLTKEGTSRPETLAISLQYQLGDIVVNNLAEGPPSQPDPPRVAPLEPISLRSLALPDLRPPRETTGIGVWLAVGPDGVPGACLLTEPTRDDALDKRLCDALLERVRFPAASAGNPRQFRGWIAFRD